MALGGLRGNETEKSIRGRTKLLNTTTSGNSHDAVSQCQYYPMAPRYFNKYIQTVGSACSTDLAAGERPEAF